MVALCSGVAWFGLVWFCFVFLRVRFLGRGCGGGDETSASLRVGGEDEEEDSEHLLLRC